MTIRIFLIITLLFSCSNKKEDLSISGSHYGYQIKLKEKVICEGDKKAYQELLDIYSDDWNIEDMLSYSLVMANKYNHPQACYDVFEILSSLPRINANTCATDNCTELGYDCLDNKTKSMALKYLILAANNKEVNALELLGNYYKEGKYVEKTRN